MYNFDVEKTTKEILNWIKDWFNENGKGCNAVIGISGGKDSSVVAGLCTIALGKDRVIGVLMPNGEQPDIDDSKKLVEHLGIESVIINIHPAVKAIKKGVKTALNLTWSKQSAINLPARIRMSTLYAVSQSVSGRVANTCNLSEDWIGYYTRYGDGAGDFSPLANLTSDEVVAVGDYIGLPYELTHKVPSDGLCGETDEDNLGFSYAVLNKYLRTGEIENKDIKEKIDNLCHKNFFKMFNADEYYSNDLNVNDKVCVQ